ncbi:MAG: RDD family protein, partial [Candidatus Eremiobacteraeota bacterium]|nr:RDD family protein [Candidatus Eremiobacteraeota bacterium]
DVDVRTGEAVSIRYELAGIGSRFLAVVVDMVAQVTIAIALLMAFAFASPVLTRLGFFGKVAGAWAIAGWVALTFLVFFGWFIIFEAWWSGRTPGKRLLGLRVVRDGGFPVDLGAAVIRNLVRIAELLLGFYTLSAVSALLSPENKRLGDFAAGTLVVRDRSAVPDLDGYLARPAHAASGLSETNRVLVERFLARAGSLDPAARMRVAGQIADHVRPTLSDPRRDLDDEALLEYLASGN